MKTKLLIPIILTATILFLNSCGSNTNSGNAGNNIAKPTAAKPSLSQEKIRNIKLCIQPLGDFDSELLDTIKKVIHENYKVSLTINGNYDLPDSLYHAPMDRYDAAGLLDFLDGKNAGRYNKIIGLTTKDIYNANEKSPYWGIFGLATISGSASIVSTFRFRNDNCTKAIFYHRVLNTVIHELGHTFGLDHCPDKNCVMTEYDGSYATVDKQDNEFCCKCKLKILPYLKK